MITIQVTFNEEQLNQMLEKSYFGDDGCPPQVQNFTKETLDYLKQALERGEYSDEIVEGEFDCILDDFMEQFVEEEEEDES